MKVLCKVQVKSNFAICRFAHLYFARQTGRALSEFLRKINISDWSRLSNPVSSLVNVWPPFWKVVFCTDVGTAKKDGQYSCAKILKFDPINIF